MSLFARNAAKIERRAADLKARIPGNTVKVDIPGGFKLVDLAGEAHFSKELKRFVQTPHVQYFREHVVDGVVKSRGRVGDAVAATMKDLDAVESVLNRHKP